MPGCFGGFSRCEPVPHQVRHRLPLKNATDSKRERILFEAAAVQVGLDLEPRPAAETCAIDLQIFHDPLHVIASLGEWNLLDPVDCVDPGIARITVAIDPFFDAA